MLNITIVVNNSKESKKFTDAIIPVNQEKESIYFTILNTEYHSDKTSAYKLKSEYGARLNPFIVVMKNGDLNKLFYKEACEDPIEDLINYLKDART